ncbi:hypothetical protein [uncultured Sphingorhabdus sp.]|uniref:HEAT repeat domain-containing protein n=1 Tax=uncultured Sphingorhabdus sp. TaxID=1686106 RepID=UPI0026180515|nr:hypothetical protein [uncultured Sphingorhabdus sp.]HMS20070.1 hypothetical protein [Sphingorhabdus sp.]
MSDPVALLFLILAIVLLGLSVSAGALYLRRKLVAWQAKRHALHVRLLRSELMQALARDETSFLIDHWSSHDRRAAFDVASQLLSLVRGNDREKLQAIAEANNVFKNELLKINRVSAKRRVSLIRQLAAFGNRSVQGTLQQLMLHDPSREVRLEAAIALAVSGELPAPWGIIRSVFADVSQPSPNHFLLFRQMMPEKTEAMIAMATMQEDGLIRRMAIFALGFGDRAVVAPILKALMLDSDNTVAEAAATALQQLPPAPGSARSSSSRPVLFAVESRAA